MSSFPHTFAHAPDVFVFILPQISVLVHHPHLLLFYALRSAPMWPNFCLLLFFKFLFSRAPAGWILFYLGPIDSAWLIRFLALPTLIYATHLLFPGLLYRCFFYCIRWIPSTRGARMASLGGEGGRCRCYEGCRYHRRAGRSRIKEMEMDREMGEKGGRRRICLYTRIFPRSRGCIAACCCCLPLRGAHPRVRGWRSGGGLAPGSFCLSIHPTRLISRLVSSSSVIRHLNRWSVV